MKARTLAVARGEHKSAPDEPKVWFTSMESLAQVLSTKNTLLLEVMRNGARLVEGAEAHKGVHMPIFAVTTHHG